MKSSGRGFYHPELDALWSAAFLLVYLAHAQYYIQIPWSSFEPWLREPLLALFGSGFYGVDLFFVLSSYLITELLLREREMTGSIHLEQFWMRRILRIWPLYFFFLLLVLPLAGHLLPSEHLTRGVVWSFVLLAGNWYCVWYGWPATVASQLWSVTVEEQFYLVWPLLLRRWSRSLPAMAFAMLGIAHLTRVFLVHHPRNDVCLWANTLARLDPIAGGILLATYLHGKPERLAGLTRAARWGLCLLGAALLLAVGRFGDHTDWRALYAYQGAALGCVLLVRAALVPQGAWMAGAAGKFLIYLGRISYGLYVYHLLAFELVRQWWPRQSPFATLTEPLGMAIVAATLSYYLLERPFLRLKQRFTLVRSRDAAV